MLRQFLLFFFCFICGSSFAGSFTFTETCIKAQQEIFHLRMNSARELVTKARKEDAENVVPYFLEGYIDFFESFIQEEEAIFKSQEENYRRRLRILEKADRKSPYYLFTQAELRLQRALVRIKFGEYVNAGLELNAAYKDLKRNAEFHPSFKPNNKTLGMIETLAGTVPSQYQWVISSIGLEGNVQEGIRKLTEFAETKNLPAEQQVISEEAMFILAFLRMHVTKDPELAWNMVSARTNDFGENLLHAYIRAAIAKSARMNDEVIRVLRNKPAGKEYMSFHYLDYLMGVACLQKLDLNNASMHFIRFVTFFKGKNYIKDAYQRLAWIASLKKDTESYDRYCSLIKRYGAADVDEDKVALRHADDKEAPDPTLLEARLLFDGGYYESAYKKLKARTPDSFASLKDQLEYGYRMGRICHEWGRLSEAIGYYRETVQKGANEEWYFAANSELCLGMIFEKIGQTELARSSYKQCLNSFKSNKEYQNSIENKARAGLKRLEGK